VSLHAFAAAQMNMPQTVVFVKGYQSYFCALRRSLPPRYPRVHLFCQASSWHISHLPTARQQEGGISAFSAAYHTLIAVTARIRVRGRASR